jgi:hypothetical protein
MLRERRSLIDHPRPEDSFHRQEAESAKVLRAFGKDRHRHAPRVNGQFTISLQIPDNLLNIRLTLDAMKRLRLIITIGCLMATFIAHAGEQLTTKAKCVVDQPTSANCNFSKEHGRESW